MVAIFSCQSLLLGTNVPNDTYIYIYIYIHHFVWTDQREKQGYKGDVSLRGGIQIICSLKNDATLYIGIMNPLLIVGLNLLIILSLYI